MKCIINDRVGMPALVVTALRCFHTAREKYGKVVLISSERVHVVTEK